jgi:hypothetical protein
MADRWCFFVLNFETGCQDAAAKQQFDRSSGKVCGSSCLIPFKLTHDKKSGRRKREIQFCSDFCEKLILLSE